jgi:hypothetical protein
MIKSMCCRLLLLCCLAFVFSGCAHDMALTKDQTKFELSKESVALLSLKMSNQNNPNFQLKLIYAFICPESETCRGEPSPSYMHKAKAPYRSEADSFNEYLLSFNLAAGTYNIRTLLVGTGIPFLAPAGAKVPLDLKAKIKHNSVVYLGHVDVTLRKRMNDNEERAALFPLINAAVTGFSTGAFDVIVEDHFDEDMKKFITEYPVLQSVNVEKSILPQWIRPENRTTK